MTAHRLGIDIGGSGVKAALVDLDDGSLIGDRVRIETPKPATPAAVAEVVARVVSGFDYDGPVGIGFPAVVHRGWVSTANNIDKTWVGVNAVDLFLEATGRETRVVNDADAAALGEARFGVAAAGDGLVIVLTFGSGIGSGVLVDRNLVPNIELGQLELEGHRPAETFFSARARRIEDLTWEAWGERAGRYISHVVGILSPRLVAVSGGVARKWDRWSSQIDGTLPVVRAGLVNNSGIVGAATLVA